MKICLVGHFVRQPDEGVRNVSAHLARGLANKHEVITINISKPLSWRKVRDYKPDIIHFILTPTNAGLVIAKIIAKLSPQSKTFISALHLGSLSFAQWFPCLHPNIFLVQSSESEDRIKALGIKTAFLPNGVDTERFCPVTVEMKNQLRRKYKLPEDSFIVLHTASIKRGRNLEILKNLQLVGDYQVVIIGRVNETRDRRIITELEQAGCLLFNNYLPNIQEIYALSDCYVFPTTSKQYCIEIPLSVLEAMSCNLPIVTTPFGALPRLFKEGNGFMYTVNENDFHNRVQQIRNRRSIINTRQKVLSFSWDRIIKDLEIIYKDEIQKHR